VYDYCYSPSWIWEGDGFFGIFFGFSHLYHFAREFKDFQLPIPSFPLPYPLLDFVI